MIFARVFNRRVFNRRVCNRRVSPRRFWVFAVLTLASSSFAQAQSQSKAPPRQRTSFNAGWFFHRGDPTGAQDQLSYAKTRAWMLPTGNAFASDKKVARPSGELGADVEFVQPGFSELGWRRLNLPHDWGVEGPFQQSLPGETGKLPWFGVGWYRKHFFVPRSDAGRRISLEIDGAMSFSTVWLNGRCVGGWPYGYASYQVDLTPYLRLGAQNALAIRLENPNDSSRWYPGGGLYRNVWLTKTSPVHLAPWGTFVATPRVSAQSATLDIESRVQNQSAKPITARLVATVLNERGQFVGEVTQSGVTIGAGQSRTVRKQLVVRSPRLWSLQTPTRYRLISRVMQGAVTLDRTETPFGIRTVQFDATRGFLLNGVRVPIQGVCNHHDLGALGAAINVRALERQIQLLKQMGCNAIRTSHNPPAPELLDLCDRLGMLVMDEFSDTWRRAKRPNGYAILFDDWAERDVRAFVRRDRNHPSIILWSLGNEVPEQGNAQGPILATRLGRYVRAEDPTRFLTMGDNNTQSGYNGMQKVVEAFGYNYKPYEYGRFRAANPTIPLYGSETASTISSRGEYFFPVSDDKRQGQSDFQVSSYDLSAPPWATTPDAEFAGQEQFPFTAGEFVWTGFDYLGEPTPYSSDVTNLLNFSDPVERARAAEELAAIGKLKVPSRSSYFGIIDLAGFKKDRFYLYQSHWRPDFPMAHILPHWNWPDRIGQVTPVHLYTSGDEAELFLNGKSLGRKKKAALQYRLRWDDVVYQPGELRVVAYKNGQKWAEDAVQTTGAAARLKLSPDRARIQSDGADLSFVTLAIADDAGLTVPRSKNRVRFQISGPGELVATDNGDATDLEAFQRADKRAFNGLALAIVRSTGQAGTIRLRAESDGLKSAEVVIVTRGR